MPIATHGFAHFNTAAAGHPAAAAASGAAQGATVAAVPATPFLTALAGTGAAQHFTDQHGSPYLARWDTVWGLIVNAGNAGGAVTWQSDIDNYCATRAGQGFNGLFSTPTANAAQGVGAFNNGNTWDGVAPFSSPGVLNGTFWARVDYLLASAEANGMTVCLDVMFTYAITNAGGPLQGWNDTQYGNYGTALGARYARAVNLVWEFGDDYTLFGENYDSHFDACLAGIRGAGDTHLISIENAPEGSSRKSTDGTITWAWGTANAQFSWCYSYNAAYDAVEGAYLESSPIAVGKMDGWYDGQSSTTESEELFMRKWAWWSLSSGARGTLYGRTDIWPWSSSALGNLTSNTFDNASLNAIWNAFTALPGWHLLVPDTSSALVTAGRGTHVTHFAGGSTSSTYTGGNTYVTASKTADGTLAVIYIPSNVTVTVDGTQMNGGAVGSASWIDPASGAVTSATVAGTFSKSAANSAGDHDWVLALTA